MTRRLAVLLVLPVMLVGAANASEQSELLYSQGLVEFHATHYSEALQLFEKAVAADPSDIYAHYYRGVTQGRLNNFAAAVSDLRVALAAKPDLDQGALELGIALVQTGANQDAIGWLQQAQRVAALDADASFFLALAQLRLGELNAARENLHRAVEHDPQLAVPARYYLGVAAYQAHDLPVAREHFEFVAAADPNAEIAREASAFLARMRGGQLPPTVPYHLYGALGFQYDSNVQLAPSDEAIKHAAAISKQADGRAVITVGGAFAPWQSDHAQFSLGYEFFQSLHFDLTQFNLEDHRPSAQFVFDAGPVQIGISARYDFYLQDTDSLLQQASVAPWMQIPEGNFGRTELFYRMRRRDFLTQPYIGVLDSFNHSAGVRQLIYLGGTDRFVSVGYRFDREDPINSQGGRFAYDGHEANAGVGWAFPAMISAELDYAYRYEPYAPPSDGRLDHEQQIVFALTKDLTQSLALTLAYFGTINNSTDPRFEYDRNIASLTAGVRY